MRKCPHPVLGPAGVHFQGPEGVRSATSLKLECGVSSQEKLPPGDGGRSRIAASTCPGGLASGGSVPSFVKQERILNVHTGCTNSPNAHMGTRRESTHSECLRTITFLRLLFVLCTCHVFYDGVFGNLDCCAGVSLEQWSTWLSSLTWVRILGHSLWLCHLAQGPL